MNKNQQRGRNEKCACGSGLKYKKCCLKETVIDFIWEKLRQTEGEVIDQHLLPFVTKILGAERIDEAWGEFIEAAEIEEEWPEEAYKLFFERMFIPWFLFEGTPSSPPLALEYLKRHGQNLSTYQRQFIEAMCQTYYSFYVVLNIIRNQEITLRDLFLKTEHKVKEKLGTQNLQRGDLIFTRILTLDAQSICVGMAPYIVPSSHHTPLLQYCKELETDGKLTPALLRTETPLLETYFDIIDELFNPPLPSLLNTDGEPLELCKIIYPLIGGLEETFKKLHPLLSSEKPGPILSDAQKDKQGHITRIEFEWLKKGNKVHKEWMNTILGHITLTQKKLIIEVNSRARAKKVQALLKKYFSKELGTPKVLLEPITERLSSSQSQKSSKEEDINNLPEVQELFKTMAKSHWKEWIVSPLPALNNQTPIEASNTKEGRELLDSILLDFERQNARHPQDLMNPNIEALRKKLKIES